MAIVLTSVACNALRRGGSPEDETDIITVSVANHHQLDVAVFNVVHGRRDRLGQVTAAATMSFTLHLRRLPTNEIQLLADPVGSPRTFTSELVRVVAGDTVQWTLESELSRSHIQIR